MDRTLRLASKTSNEIFMLRYPRSVLYFCEYDLAEFAENSISVCNDALKNGEIDIDRAADLRNSLKDAHVFIEHHMRTIYDKIVLDCWIDYVCRRDNVGTSSLWNRFTGCKTAFEREVFARLCDYRYNRAINEWLNLVRVQDYAKNKISFIFSKQLSGAGEAAARRNYFDMMFSVTAQELGCKIDELGVTKVFTLGRVPSVPFMFPTISKDIVKNLLSDLDYSEDYSRSDYSSELSDQIAMDAFARMKRGLAQEYDSYNISRTQMEDVSPRVYMPCGLKAAVDLEIDALIESGAWLSRCKRCGRYFLRDAEHMEEYCSLVNGGGKTCLEIYEMEHPKTTFTPELERECREVIDAMYARIDADMSLEEYESWRTYLGAMQDKVKNGEITPDELRDFLKYSRSMDLTRSTPVKEVPKKEQAAPKERIVKPFVPERIQRSDIPAAPKHEEEEPAERPARREGFFTSPSVQRQKSERSPMSHIIRAGEKPAESGGGFVGFVESNARRGFTADFAEEKPAQNVAKRAEPARFSADDFGEGVAPRGGAAKRAEPARYSADDFGGIEPRKDVAKRAEPARYSADDFGEGIAPRGGAAKRVEPARFSTDDFGGIEPREDVAKRAEIAEKLPTNTNPRKKVVKKNAAAISAYGKMSGSAAVPQMEQISRPEPSDIFTPAEFNADEKPNKTESAARRAERSAAETDPYKDVEGIFDVLEQSESAVEFTHEQYRADDIPPRTKHADEPIFEPMSDSVEELDAPKPRKKRTKKPEPSPEWEQSRDTAEQETQDVPSGFWTEERHLFPENSDEGSELDMLKEKKRSRSNKTRRLYDALMKEPEDNPNFRKKR